MRDNDLFAVIRQELKTLAPLRGLVDRRYLLRYQPTQQGVPNDATIWMHKVVEQRRGTAKLTSIVTPTGLSEKEEQSMETTIQFTLKQPTSTDPAALTPGDVMKIIANVVQSSKFIAALLEYGVSVLRVQQIRVAYGRNDSDQFAEEPSFDLVVKHSDVFIDGMPEISKIEFDLIRVPDLAA